MPSNWQTLSLIPTRTNTDSSCSVLCRASTSRNVSQIKEVHGRDNLGHAAAGRSRMTLFGIMACKIQSRLWVKRRNTDSGVLTAPCGGADNSSDVDLFGEIGSHIWSTIYLTIRGGRLGVLKSGLVLAAGVAGPRNRRAGLSRRRIARERLFRRWRDGTRSVLSIYLRGAKQHERDYLCSRMKKS